MSNVTVPDRRRRRHHETADEVVGVAVALMAERGAAALTLGEVARRMGIRTPSLYGYFPSKAALCDEVFARGWRALATVLRPYVEGAGPDADPRRLLTGAMQEMVLWAAGHPAHAQLMFWRPVPHWEPSPAAYAPAVEVVDALTGALAALQRHGHLRADADLAEAAGVWTVLVSGLISQHLANEPGSGPDGGRFLPLAGPLADTFLSHYATARPR